MSTIKISDETFEENVIKNNKPIIIEIIKKERSPPPYVEYYLFISAVVAARLRA